MSTKISITYDYQFHIIHIRLFDLPSSSVYYCFFIVSLCDFDRYIDPESNSNELMDKLSKVYKFPVSIGLHDLHVFFFLL